MVQRSVPRRAGTVEEHGPGWPLHDIAYLCIHPYPSVYIPYSLAPVLCHRKTVCCRHSPLQGYFYISISICLSICLYLYLHRSVYLSIHLYQYILYILASVLSHRKTVCCRHSPLRMLRIQISFA